MALMLAKRRAVGIAVTCKLQKEGQVVTVKVLEADEKGRLRLSMKALLAPEAPAEQASEGSSEG